MKRRYLVGLLAIVLSGCGGSGGGNSAPAGAEVSTALPQIQGFYQGTLSSGRNVDALILEDGSWWNMYGVPSGAALLVQGIAIGTITASNTASNDNLKISSNDFSAPGTPPIFESGNASLVGRNLGGTLTEGATSTNFTFTAPVATIYNYNTPASLSLIPSVTGPSSITGSWTGGLLDGGSATVNILADGTLTATTSLGCSATGTIVPRPSGKNVFNISLTFGAAPCAQPNQTVSGVALTYLLSDGASQLIAGFVNSPQTTANSFFAAVRCTTGLVTICTGP